MAEKNTHGAVHLTSLSLDLTQFNENIQQIKDATAQAADEAVQNFAKMREALNIPVENMTLNVNTQQFNQSINQASQSIQNFSSNTTNALRQVESVGKLTLDNISVLLKGLNVEDSKENQTVLLNLKSALEGLEKSYSNLKVTTRDGNLFQAIVESSDDAGRTIRSTFDLTGEEVTRLSSQIIEKSSQLEKVAEKQRKAIAEQQKAIEEQKKAEEEQRRLLAEQAKAAEELSGKYSDLSINAKAFSDSLAEQKIESPAMEALVQKTKDFEQEIKDASSALSQGNLSVDEANAKYKDLLTTFSVLIKYWKDVSKEAETSSSFVSVNADQISRLALQYAKLAKSIEASKVSDDTGMKSLATDAKLAEEELKQLASDLEKGNITVKEASVRYKELTSELIKANNQFVDTAREQRSVIEENERVKKENEALVKSFEQVNSQYDKLSANVKKAKIPDIVKEDFLEKISKAKENIDGLQKEIISLGNVSAKEVYLPKFDEASQDVKSLTENLDQAIQKQDKFLSDEKRAELLAKRYEEIRKQLANMVTGMTKQELDIPEMSNLIKSANDLEKESAEAAESLRKLGTAPKEAEKDFSNFKTRVDELNVTLSHTRTSATEYKNSLVPIEQQAKQTVASLKVLEKSATFTTSKQKVAELRAEYEQFINKLKNTHVGTNEAERELAELQQRFTELEGTIKTGHTWLENWVNKISESAKWQIANSALNLIRRSFGDLTGTIIDTENAVIELQRVLNDKSLSNSAITDELYQIAYQYGQTFDAVQETAVKFAQTGMEWSEVVDATRATMLGLNTAELEVTTATEGLIAVMAQFKIDASDLESVIDKINKTADNFPVTSEKIVAALQRAGGTAHAFNMTLEETIATITTLAAQTGRSGENIGTALNSLIIFTNKTENLELFSSLSEEIDAVVKKFQAGSGSVIDIWTQLGKEIKKLSKEQEDALFNSSAYEEFASKFEAEAAEYAGTIQQIYGTAGAYRRNYLTVLLQDMDTVEDVMSNLTDAIGYSMQENETAMEAFSKKWNQLVISAKELAIQFGNMGFLDSMKWVVETSSAVLQLTQSFGGLRTAMLATMTVILAIKKNKIDEKFNSLKTAISATKAAVTAYNTATAAGATATTAFSAAVGALQLTFGGFVAIASLVATALSAVFGWMKQTREEADRARQEAIEAGEEAVQKSKELSEAYREYDKARSSGSSDERRTSTENLLKLLGYEISDIEILTKRYGSLEEAIESLMDAEYERNKEAAKNAYEAKKSEEEFQKVQRQSIEIAQEDKRVVEELNKAGYEYGNWINALNRTGRDITFAFDIPDFASAQPQLDKYNDMLEVMGNIFTADERANSKLYQSVLKARDALSAYITEVEDLKEKYEQYGMSREEYDKNMAEAEEKFNAAMKEASATVEQAVMSLEDMGKAIDSLNKKMDSFQSSVKSVQSVIEEYNKTGIMTADMLQTIMGLEPEYIDLIDINSNSLSINQEKLESLMQVNDNYMIQLAAMKVQKEYEALATELQKQEYDNLTAAEITNMLATEQLSGDVYNLAMQFLTGQKTADQFNAEIQDMARKSGLAAEKAIALGNAISGMTGSLSSFLKVANMNFTGTFSSKLLDGHTFQEWADMFDKKQIDFATYQKYWNRYQQGKFDVVSTGGSSSGLKTWMPSTSKSSSGGSSKSSGDPYKEEKDALNDLLDMYEHSIFLIEKNEKTSQSSADKIVAIYREMQSAIHNTAENYRKQMGIEDDSYTASLSEKWWSIQETIEKVLQGVYDETVRTYKAALNNLEHEYESAEQRLDYSYMGENLKKQLDYQVKIQKEAERELERLAKLGMDANSDAAQDVINTWYDAEKAIREIGQKIAADILDPFDDFIDLADHFELWEYMDFTKVDYLRDKLAALNQLLEDGTISAKEYSAQLKSISYAIYDAQKELYEQEKQTVSDNLKNVTEGYKAQQDDLKKQKDQLNDYYDTIIDGYNKEIDAWNKKKEQVSDYYDTLIDNLRDVEKANERINKQVDYYNSRQKIITNLEQAQARSGVEWREKEMEYQQQLIDLDEEWRRTLEEWSIEDQITALEKLKESAIADIDLSIQKIRDTITMTEEAKKAAIEAIEAEIDAINDLITAAEEAAEAEIEVINDKIKEMSKFIAESIKNGTVDGLVDSREEFDKALVDGTNAMLDYIDKGKTAMVDSAEQTANGVYGIYYTDFISPMNDSISNLASTMATSIASGAEQGAKQALSTFQTSFINPLKQEMASLMKDVQTANTTIANASTTSAVSAAKKITTAQAVAFNAGKGPVSADTGLTGIRNAAWTLPGFTPTLATQAKDNVKNVYITNINRNVEDAVNNTQRTLASFGYN